jgi:hypothetical protein
MMLVMALREEICHRRLEESRRTDVLVDINEIDIWESENSRG